MKIMTISDSPKLSTGLGRVHRHVISALKNDHILLPCCWFGQDSSEIMAVKMGAKPKDMTFDGVQMMSVPKRNGSMNDMKSIYDIASVFKPDLIFTIGDYVDFYYIHAIKNKLDYAFKWAAYLTVEVEEFDPKLIPLFTYANVLAVPSKFSQTALFQATGRPVEIIPYGVEDVFFKKSKDVKVNGTRFITIASNTWRKDLPVIIQAAAILKTRGIGPEKASFYIHTNTESLEPWDPCYYDLASLCRKLGVSEYFSFPDGNSVFTGATDEYLYWKYAESKFFILPSICESFAIPAIEAMSLGIPLLGNPTSALIEHMDANRGFPLPNREEIVPPSNSIKRVCPEGLADSIIRAIQVPEAEYQIMSQACKEYAEFFKWETMEGRIKRLIKGITIECEIPVEIISPD